MEPFRRVTGVGVPIARSNFDTDQIIPARFLSRSRIAGLAPYLFHDLRFAPDGQERADFVLNLPPYRPAQIVVAERNFGCGSSRENAVWALYDYGFRAAIAPSFGDIFNNNGLKNGLLPVVLPEPVVANLLAQLEAAPGARLSVDLASLLVTAPDGTEHPFEIDPFARHCLLEGVDELGYTLENVDQIAAFERRYGRENQY